LLSLGIADPVTRETHGGGNKYYRELAKQISTMLEEPLKVSTETFEKQRRCFVLVDSSRCAGYQTVGGTWTAQ